MAHTNVLPLMNRPAPAVRFCGCGARATQVVATSVPLTDSEPVEHAVFRCDPHAFTVEQIDAVIALLSDQGHAPVVSVRAA